MTPQEASQVRAHFERMQIAAMNKLESETDSDGESDDDDNDDVDD
jgi:hypothetical protein